MGVEVAGIAMTEEQLKEAESFAEEAKNKYGTAILSGEQSEELRKARETAKKDRERQIDTILGGQGRAGNIIANENQTIFTKTKLFNPTSVT
jgi:hypothetical protein